jgi:ubiquinone/menaquinone biosynthesis C-methylase UbiE
LQVDLEDLAPVRSSAASAIQSSAVEGGRVLELGCGMGVGGEIILERFRAAELEFIDIDPGMVERARRRLAGRPGTRVTVGDATRIVAPEESFDALFDFGAIHQIPDWPVAVAKVRRVLEPGGRFFFEGGGEPASSVDAAFTVEAWPAPESRPFSREALPTRGALPSRRLAPGEPWPPLRRGRSLGGTRRRGRAPGYFRLSGAAGS